MRLRPPPRNCRKNGPFERPGSTEPYLESTLDSAGQTSQRARYFRMNALTSSELALSATNAGVALS